MAADLVRFQIEIAAERLAMIEDLMRRCDLQTRSDVFNAAITIFAWAVAEVEHGNDVGSVDQKRTVHLLRMRELEFAAKNVSNS